jgi:hypothetical protein
MGAVGPGKRSFLTTAESTGAAIATNTAQYEGGTRRKNRLGRDIHQMPLSAIKHTI